LLGFLALRKPTFHAASFTFTATWIILLSSLAALRYAPRRDFWFGFVVFGWGYALLAFAPGCGRDVRPYLITSHPMGDLARLLGLIDSHGVASAPLTPDRVPRGSGLDPWFMTDAGDRFQRIGHSILAIAAALAGGCVVVRMNGNNRRAESALKPVVDD
jgi:hypothetical protein